MNRRYSTPRPNAWALMILLSGVVSWQPAWSQQPAPDPQPVIVKLTLHAAPPASPALKYQLLPPRAERRAGNAVPFYYRTLLVYYQSPGRQAHEKQYVEHNEAWQAGPRDAAELEQMKKWVAAYPPGAADQLREAVFREECNFDFRLHERGGIALISFLLPEIQEMRNLGRFLDVKSRVEIAEARYDDALASLQFGYKISRDTASEPLLINGLVGIAVAGIMNSDVERWIGSPEAPNLYWALATLPRPLIDLRPALVQEVRLPETMFPFLKDAETADRSPEEWQRLLSDAALQLTTNFGSAQAGRETDKTQANLLMTGLLMRAYPLAKAELKKSGYDPQRLERMPVAQAVSIYMLRTVRYIADEFAKGANLPTQQRELYYAGLEKRLEKEGYFGSTAPREPIPLAGLLMPAVGHALRAQSRLERDMAALQTLEAIRAHLAETGSLPESLGDITVLPVPVNPVTNEPFAYGLKDGMAILDVPPVRKGLSPQEGKRYELVAAKARR